MEDNTEKMIASARGKARRMARKTDLTYQQALDKVARDLGREHWAAYMADPVPVPRDAEPSSKERVDAKVAAALRQSYNILLSDLAAETGHSRDELVEKAADILMGGVRLPSYFDERGRDALTAFMHWEMARADAEGREPSLPAMVAGIRNGMQEASRSATTTGDRLGDWLAAVSGELAAGHEPHGPSRTIMELALMEHKERSSVLGTMDRALAAFAPARMAA